MKKYLAAFAIAAATPVAMIASAPAAVAQAEGEFKIPTPP